MKIIIFICIMFLVSIKTSSQNLTLKSIEGVWENEKNLIYSIYDSTILHYYSLYPEEIVYEKLFFGFYDNCEPLNIQDLKSEGTGTCFFILGANDYNNHGVIKQNILDCWSISIDNYRNKEDYLPDSLYMHFSRKEIVEYKKVDFLPERLINYIKKEQPKLYSKYLK